MMIPIRYFTTVTSTERTRISQRRIGAISTALLTRSVLETRAGL
jgi:hypothetical protein